MAKWILCFFLFLGITSCESETKTDTAPKISLPPTSGTVAPPHDAAVPLIFFLKEKEILNNSHKTSVKDYFLFRSLPAGVFRIESDTIIFGDAPTEWISSGITRWPATGRVALADAIILDKPLFSDEIAIFPEQPGVDGYLPGCFSCPEWMVRQRAGLVIFWERFLKNE